MQIGVKIAFVNGKLTEELYLDVHYGINRNDNEGDFLWLHKALCGVKKQIVYGMKF